MDQNKFFVTNNAVEGYNFRLKSIFRGEKVPFTVWVKKIEKEIAA